MVPRKVPIQHRIRYAVVVTYIVVSLSSRPSTLSILPSLTPLFLMAILLSSRLSPIKLITVAVVINLCLLFFFNDHFHGIVGSRRDFGMSRFKTTLCEKESVVVSNQTVTIDILSNASTSTAIPEKIWYKLGPKGVSDESRQFIEDCLQKNPTYSFEFMTDISGEFYVKRYYAHRQDIIDTYMAIPIAILRADLLRYLILYHEGGVWNDLDVSCEEKVINDWIPEEYKKNAQLVVGLEFDCAWEDDNFLHSQFASWTIMSKPGSKHMMRVIDDILEGLQQKAVENNVTIADLKYSMVGDVVDLTGPKRMTRSIVKSLELMLDTTIDDRNISGLKVPKILGDVLILPGMAFAGLQSDYPKDEGPAYVAHHYAGTWKNDHGGELP